MIRSKERKKSLLWNIIKLAGSSNPHIFPPIDLTGIQSRPLPSAPFQRHFKSTTHTWKLIAFHWLGQKRIVQSLCPLLLFPFQTWLEWRKALNFTSSATFHFMTKKLLQPSHQFKTKTTTTRQRITYPCTPPDNSYILENKPIIKTGIGFRKATGSLAP